MAKFNITESNVKWMIREAIGRIDETIDRLLLEAKSPEEIKKILKFKFCEKGNVPEPILNAVFNLDPTKKKSYTQWLLSLWNGESDSIVRAIKDGDLKRLFGYAKERAGSGFDLAATSSFEKAMTMLPDVDPIFTNEGTEEENDFDVVFESDEWKIAVPHTYEADKKLGQGCKWCTAGYFGDGPSYYEKYSSFGPLWVNFDLRRKETCPVDGKTYPYTRYQLLFEYGSAGEFMDSHDDRINFDDIDMPEDVIEFYGEQNERYADMIRNGTMSEEEKRDQYEDSRWEHAHRVHADDGTELWLMPAYNEDFEPDFDDCEYYVFDCNLDMRDPISWTTYNPDDFILDNGHKNLPVVILKDTTDKTIALVYEDSGYRYKKWEEYYNIEKWERVNDKVYILSKNDFSMWTDDCDYDVGIYFKNMPFTPDNVVVSEIRDGVVIDLFDTSQNIHSVYYFDYVDTTTILNGDSAIKTENFGAIKIEEDENGIFVEGELSGRRYIDQTDKGDNNLSIIARCEGDSSLYIVATDNKYHYNIYDSKTKKLILLRNASKIEDYGSIALLSFNDEYQTIYDYVNQKTLTPKITDFGPVDKFNVRFYTGETLETKDLLLFNLTPGTDFQFDNLGNSSILQILGDDKTSTIFCVRNNDFIKFYDASKREMFGEDDVINWGNFGSKNVVLLKDSNGLFFYNFISRKTIDREHCTQNRPVVLKNGCFVCGAKNGDYMIVNPNIGPIAVETRRVYRQGNDTYFTMTDAFSTTWAFFNEDFTALTYWPSKEGVKTSCFTNNADAVYPKASVNGVKIMIMPEVRKYKVEPETVEALHIAQDYMKC